MPGCARDSLGWGNPMRAMHCVLSTHELHVLASAQAGNGNKLGCRAMQRDWQSMPKTFLHALVLMQDGKIALGLSNLDLVSLLSRVCLAWGICLAWGVLHNIHALVLELVAQAEQAAKLERQQGQNAQAGSPEGDDGDTQQLHPDLVAAVEGAIPSENRVPEEAESYDAPEARGTVHCEGVDDVVHVELLHEHRGALVDQAPDEADDQCLPSLRDGAPGCDGDKTCKDA
eukprot:CAMPEP_0179038314 /NCGR_PEP_ID=MMETSP0796-20121207/14570_1 /TAXON_ID=73915 /ORGANISM="Pyrodinium bahamense, Strain pbaha01" /LENGTH=228 /DNA_ID=CAMNT_0020734629 /DNA_START=90 /DNA_END=775 /DNA_ORIENTATION=-